MLETYMQHLSIGISIFMLGAITGAVFSYLRYKDWIKHLECYEQWYHDHGLRLKKMEAVYTASNKARQRAHSEICPDCSGEGYEDYEPSGDPIICMNCGGSGKLLPC